MFMKPTICCSADLAFAFDSYGDCFESIEAGSMRAVAVDYLIDPSAVTRHFR